MWKTIKPNIILGSEIIGVDGKLYKCIGIHWEGGCIELSS